MKEGEIAEILTKENQKFNGIILPSPDKETIMIKLESGYNIGIKRNNVKTYTSLGKLSIKKNNQKYKAEHNKNLKTILILHTGGTFASKVSYKTGAVSPSFSPEDIMQMFPELKSIANIKSKLVGNMFSEDIRFSHYNKIGKEIGKEIDHVDGIIVTHGTDNLSLGACALSFILENLSKPVIFVGSQRSSDRPSTDSALNLIAAANFIAKTEFNEVAICMHAKSSDEKCYMLPACKTKKLHTSRRDAFRAVNSQPIAEIPKSGNVSFLQEYKKKEHEGKLKLRLFNEKLRIGILKAHLNMFVFEVKNYEKFDGVILEGTGIGGHFPINFVDKETKEHEKIYNELKKLANKIPVVASSNCLFGRINMNVYETGRKMQQAGILGNFSDMTTETAFIKLAWLLSNYKKSEVKNLVMKNFRGELAERTEYEEEFI